MGSILLILRERGLGEPEGIEGSVRRKGKGGGEEDRGEEEELET